MVRFPMPAERGPTCQVGVKAVTVALHRRFRPPVAAGIESARSADVHVESQLKQPAGV